MKGKSTGAQHANGALIRVNVQQASRLRQEQQHYQHDIKTNIQLMDDISVCRTSISKLLDSKRQLEQDLQLYKEFTISLNQTLQEVERTMKQAHINVNEYVDRFARLSSLHDAVSPKTVIEDSRGPTSPGSILSVSLYTDEELDDKVPSLVSSSPLQSSSSTDNKIPDQEIAKRKTRSKIPSNAKPTCKEKEILKENVPVKRRPSIRDSLLSLHSNHRKTSSENKSSNQDSYQPCSQSVQVAKAKLVRASAIPVNTRTDETQQHPKDPLLGSTNEKQLRLRNIKIPYAEPKLNSKLRQGDPHTFA